MVDDSIDDLAAIAGLSAHEDIWVHVDGCIGALLAIAPRARHVVHRVEPADSLALDLHKCLHAPFDIGCALLRDWRQHASQVVCSKPAKENDR